MAYSAAIEDGMLPGSWKNSEASNTIAQFAVVCLDTTTEGGLVRPDSGNAGVVAGVNLSTGTSTTGANPDAVQPGDTMRVAIDRVERVIVANGVTVAVGDKLYVTSSSTGPVTNVSSGNKFVGTAFQASLGGTADVISARIHTMAGV